MRSRRVLLPLLAVAWLCGCRPPEGVQVPEETVEVPAGGTVVVYVEAPRYLAQPILKMFGDQTGITVEAHYREEIGAGFFDTVRKDAEAGKADLLWTASPLPAVALARAGLAVPFRPAGARPVPSQYRDRGFRWIGFAADPRVLIFNHDLVKREEAPESIEDLVAGRWAGKAAVPRIAEGPAAFQAAALFARRGDAEGRKFFEAIAAAGNRIVATSDEVRRLVASGQVPWGVVDLDQAICAKRQADPVSIFFPDRIGPGAVVVPQAAVLLARAPHPAQAKGLYGYLFATETAWEVGQNDCALMSLLPVVAMGIPKPEWVPVLGAVNVMSLDNDAVFDAFTRQASYFASWGGATTAP